MRGLVTAAAVTLVVASVGVATFLAWRSGDDETPAQRALLGYFRGPFVELHQQTRMVQGGLAGLVEGEERPSARAAERMLRDNLIPSLDYLASAADEVVVSDDVVRPLHEGYVALLRETRADAEELAAIFASAESDDEARRQARPRIAAVGDRFERWNERVRATWAEHGVRLAPAADAGAPDAR